MPVALLLPLWNGTKFCHCNTDSHLFVNENNHQIDNERAVTQFWIEYEVGPHTLGIGNEPFMQPSPHGAQLVLEVERVLRGHRVVGLNRYDGEPIAPAQIEARIGQLAQEAG